MQPLMQGDWCSKRMHAFYPKALTLELIATVCRSPEPGTGKQHGLRTQSTQLCGGLRRTEQSLPQWRFLFATQPYKIQTVKSVSDPFHTECTLHLVAEVLLSTHLEW